MLQAFCGRMFNGESKKRPTVSLRGKIKEEDRTEFIRRARVSILWQAFRHTGAAEIHSAVPMFTELSAQRWLAAWQLLASNFNCICASVSAGVLHFKQALFAMPCVRAVAAPYGCAEFSRSSKFSSLTVLRRVPVANDCKTTWPEMVHRHTTMQAAVQSSTTSQQSHQYPAVHCCRNSEHDSTVRSKL